MTFDSLKDNYLQVIKEKYALFTGRSGRAEFWQFMLANFVISFVLGLIPIVRVLSGVYALAVFLPSLGLSVRRLQDIDKPWQLLFLSFIPLANIYLIYLLTLEGTQGDNQYGADPRA